MSISEHSNSIKSADLPEFRSKDSREEFQLKALQDLFVVAKNHSPYYQKELADIDISEINSLKDIYKLPILHKSDVIQLQQINPPFGGIATKDLSEAHHLFLSPGPITHPQFSDTENWDIPQVLRSAAITPSDIVINCFSYTLTPGGMMFDYCLRNYGCPVIPGGAGNTDGQLQLIEKYKPTGYIGTPEFLEMLLKKGEDMGIDVSSIKKGVVSAGPFTPTLRQCYSDRGINMKECYATAELGVIAYEADSISDGLVCADNCFIEILKVGTNTPVEDGEKGEVVVTKFNHDYPILRLATGDLSSWATLNNSNSKYTNARIRGWQGRSDQATKVRGMFVRPEQIIRISNSIPAISKIRATISLASDSKKIGADDFTIQIEMEKPSRFNIRETVIKIEQAVRNECGLRASVQFVPPGTIPDDGKLIEDKRVPQK